MPDVTVLGAGGATVTIALTSAQNAAAAQVALIGVSKLVQAGVLEQQVWSGTGTIPAPGALLGGAIISTPGDVGALTPQFTSAVVNAQGNTTLIGAVNAQTTVVGGDGANLVYGNNSSNGFITFGASNSALVNFAGTADARTDQGNYVVLTGAGATSNVNAGSGGLIVTGGIAGNAGSTTVNTGTGNVTVFAAGASTVPVTVNASAGNLFLVNQNAGSAIINPGAANVTVVGNATDLGGRTTLFGGSGSVVIANGQGAFTGGAAGGNVMFSSTVAGSATLQGGGAAASGTIPGTPGDWLIARGENQLLIAGAGNATLFARTADATGGSTFLAGAGFSTVFGHGQGGNTFLFAGAGSALVDARDGTGTATANIFRDFAQPGGKHFIADFTTGVDQFQLTGDFTLNFFTANQVGNPFGDTSANAVTQLSLTNGTTYYFFDTNNDGVQDVNVSDITKLG
jgi:serralysin